MDVSTLLQQLQTALVKPQTVSVQTQTNISYDDFDETIWDMHIDLFQKYFDDIRDAKRRKITTTVPATPEPLTLQQPPSRTSTQCTDEAFAEKVANIADNLSEPFDENDKMDPEEDEIVLDQYCCPQCSRTASGKDVKEVFGLKRNRHDQLVPQSWCTKCRTGYTKADGLKVFNEESSIINRKGAIICVTNNGTKGLDYHDTIRKAGESWKEAEERHRAKSHPIVQKRAKLMSILSKQEEIPMKQVMKKYEGKTTVELFCKIKQESPGLLTPLGIH